MKLRTYKVVFTAVGLIGILVIACPVLANILQIPSSEQYSELYVLGPDKLAQSLPSNILPDQNYTVYLGIGNHLGTFTYYVGYVYLRNQTGTLPNATTGAPSSTPALYEYRMFANDGLNSTFPLTFSLSDVSFFNNQSIIGSITLNGKKVLINNAAQLDQENNGYYYQIFIELWAFNTASGTFEYQNRFVYFWFNVTT